MRAADRPSFTFLGHSAVQCTLPDGRVILIDPWLSNPSCPAELREPSRVDAILVTHGHFDHLGETVALAKRFSPEAIVANYELCGWLESMGVANCSGMNLGGSQEVLGCRVTQVPALHTSSIATANGVLYGGVASGFVVSLPGGYTFYHAGDTALFSDMALIAELYRPRLAFLPIGDLYTMDSRQAALACKFLEVHTVVPIHWGTFPALKGRPEDLRRELASRGVNCEVIDLLPGAIYRPHD